ncbi:MAG: hypothetical protein ACYS8Y_13420, partial [Planctomycetota bacterium]
MKMKAPAAILPVGYDAGGKIVTAFNQKPDTEAIPIQSKSKFVHIKSLSGTQQVIEKGMGE